MYTEGLAPRLLGAEWLAASGRADRVYVYADLP